MDVLFVRIDKTSITTNNISCQIELNCAFNVYITMRLLEYTHSDLEGVAGIDLVMQRAAALHKGKSLFLSL